MDDKYAEMLDEMKAELAELVKERTVEFAEYYGTALAYLHDAPDCAALDGLSAAGRDVVLALSDGFGACGAKLARAFGAVLGTDDLEAALKELTAATDDDDERIEYVFGAAVVPTENPNHHSYDLGEPVVVMDRRDDGLFQAVTLSGYQGNNLPWNPRDLAAVRPATDEEVDAFLDGFGAECSLFGRLAKFLELRSRLED